MNDKVILLLEDDLLQRKLYALELHDAGYKVIEYENSGQILQGIEAHQPLLIITDLVMPDHEGVEGIFKVIKTHKIPIIAISSYKSYLLVIEDLVDITIEKPIPKGNLLMHVEQLLNC